MIMELIDEGLLNTYNRALERYVNTKEKIKPSKAAIIALLNSYASKMSDVNFLIKNKRYASANIIMRTAFENEIYIRYIFERNGRRDTRATAYFYSDFQKLSDYLAHLDSTDNFNSKELIDSMNNAEKNVLGKFSSVNEYLNHFRQNFRKCFRFNGNEKTKGLNFRLFNDTEPFQQCKIDRWKWYNDDKSTSNFRSLVLRLKYADEYMALYSPTSDAIHSDGLRTSLQITPHELSITEKFEPSMLTFFRGSILENIKYMQRSTNDLQAINQLKKLYKQGQNIFVANYMYNRGKR